ncbi:MAG TPA: (2Fe-2S)-binding protein [Clostridia bacterium]|nr:(2Fe-2S)-binding protein [Clostridia bacterium]
MTSEIRVAMKVNGTRYHITTQANRTLAEVLREDLGLLGTKIGCNKGECGACTVIMNGRPVTSCLVLAVQAAGATVTTIEGLADGAGPSLLERSFVEEGAVQCGFCTPGMVMSAEALLAVNPHPSEVEIETALEGNLCRCTGYRKIVAAVQKASQSRR